MPKVAVHEKVPFNTPPEDQFFHINLTHRRLKPWSQEGLYHYHNSIELLYCISEKLKISFVSEDVILDEGDFIFINSAVPHSTNAPLGKNEHYCIKFEPLIVNTKTSVPLPDANYFFSLLPDYLVFRKAKDGDYIRYLFNRCRDNYTHSDYVKRLVLESAIMQISAYIFENSLKNLTLNDINEKNSIFSDTVAYINQNYATVTLEDAAKNVSMSYSYFSRIFKKEFNTSFSKYITSVRVQKSMDFLSNTNMSISDIAVECGFSNLSHYTKCFKEEKGITPNKLRSIVKNR